MAEWIDDLKLPYGAISTSTGSVSLPLGAIQYAKTAPDTSFLPADGREWKDIQYPGLIVPPTVFDGGRVQDQNNQVPESGFNGAATSGKSLLFSANGQTFRLDTASSVISQPDTQGGVGRAPSYVNGRYFLFNDDSSWMSSADDGLTWSKVSSPAQYYTSIGYAGGLYVVLTLNGGSTYYTSPDLITWTQRTSLPSSGNFTIQFSNGGITVINRQFDSVMFVTADGINWIQFANFNSFLSMQFKNGIFYLYLSSGQVYTTTTGTSYTLLGTLPLPTNVSVKNVVFSRGAFLWIGNSTNSGLFGLYQTDPKFLSSTLIYATGSNNGYTYFKTLKTFFVLSDGSMVYEFVNDNVPASYLERIKNGLPNIKTGLSPVDGTLLTPFIKVAA